jgi:hypothetical protein
VGYTLKKISPLHDPTRPLFSPESSSSGALREVDNALAAQDKLAQQQLAVIAQLDARGAALAFATRRERAGASSDLEQIDAQRSPVGRQPAGARDAPATARHGGQTVRGDRQRLSLRSRSSAGTIL